MSYGLFVYVSVTIFVQIDVFFFAVSIMTSALKKK